MIKHAVVKGLSVFFIAAVLMTCISSDAAAGNGFTLYGDIARIALPVAALAMTVAKGDKDGAIQFGEAFATTAAVTYGLQYTVNAEEARTAKSIHSLQDIRLSPLQALLFFSKDMGGTMGFLHILLLRWSA